MKDLMQIFLGFSASAVCVGALLILKPKGGTGKSVLYIFTLIFMCIAVSLVVKIKTADFKFSVPTGASLTANADVTAASAEYICAAALHDAGVSFNKISVNTDIGENGSIFINKITVYSSGDAAIITKTVTDTIKTNGVEIIDE